MKLAFWDIESNGLLTAKTEKDGTVCPPMDRVHSVTIIIEEEGKPDRFISACDQPGYELGGGGRGWERMPIKDALHELAQCDLRVAFNGQDFDERAIPMIYPWWKPKPASSIIDPLLLSRLLYPDIHIYGPNGHKIPGHMKRLHSLKTWGMRLGTHKGDYNGGWAQWSEEMQDYCERDTIVLRTVFRWMMSQKPAPEAAKLEHQFAHIIRRQETRGFQFNMDKATALLAKLTAREAELELSLIATFGQWWEYGKAAHSKAQAGSAYAADEDDPDADDPVVQEERRQQWLARQEYVDVVIPTMSRSVAMTGFPSVEVTRISALTGKPLKPYIGPPRIQYTQGAAYTPIQRVEFSPSSRAHVRKRLLARGWEPTKFTKGGKTQPPQPVVDDAVLKALDPKLYPEAVLLAEYYLVQKRIGMLAAGKKAWMKVARPTQHPNGTTTWRIHGRVNTCGAATSRCTHMDPNMAQVPKNSAAKKEYPDQPYLWGEACRDLFEAAEGYELVGFDGSSLELCMEAHYLFPWDKGAFAKAVTEGRKEDGTDSHSLLRDGVGVQYLGTGEGGRDNAKTVQYAFLYGAGGEKIGSIVIPYGTAAEKKALGNLIKGRMLEANPALAQLIRHLDNTVEHKKFLVGLDGRILRIRMAHAALNTLLQSAGAIVMKKALVILDERLQLEGLIPGRDYEFVANVHDEAQAEVLPQHVDLYRRLALEALPLAGKALGLNCPLKADCAVGKSWKHTH